MKNTICILLCALLLASCTKKAEVMPHEENPTSIIPEAPGKAWMEMTDDSLTASGMEYTVHNDGGQYLIYGEPFSLQVEESGNWYELIADVPENFAFPAIGYELDGVRNTEKTQSLDWTYLYGELLPGHYRLVKDMRQGYKEIFLALEFEIEAQT